jgi:excisionase family DNA binding protein
MSVFDFIKGELLEIIEWTDDSRDTLSYRFPDDDKAIKNGAQLIVRESQAVQFVYLGEFGDTFGPGKHTLTTDNIPILTRLKSWKYGFNSPFKADVYYLNTRLFTGNKWGTANPIMVRDEDFGIVRARAFGIYDFKIVDAKLFLKEVAGSDQNFRLDEFSDTMRSRIVSVFSDALASARIPVLDVASRFTELGDALLPLINPVVSSKYGIQIASFVVENVSVPPEVEQAIDKKSSMAAIGNLNDFVKYQMAKGMEQPGGAGAAGTASELAVGFAIAQQIMAQQNLGNLKVTGATGAPGAAGAAGAPGATGAAGATGASVATGALPELLSPADVAKSIGVSEDDVMAIIQSGELSAKKIGTSYRVTRAALDKYLAS